MALYYKTSSLCPYSSFPSSYPCTFNLYCEKTVEFTFEQETGKLLDSARQLVTVWPITNDSELSLNIKYAHSLLVRYGVNPKRLKK